jgi:hypothetical protein
VHHVKDYLGIRHDGKTQGRMLMHLITFRAGFAAVVLMIGLNAPLAIAADLDVSIRKAPIVPDGTTAGAVTDFVLTFVDKDPDVAGIGLSAGATVSATLPEGFINNDDPSLGTNLAILLQGWPQSPVFPFPWMTEVVGNTVTNTLLTADYLPGVSGPGAKQFHLLLPQFTNPKPGKYEVLLEIDANADNVIDSTGVGTVHIIPRSRPSVDAVSVFSGGGPPPPFNNGIYQTAAPGEELLPVGLYMWGKDSAPLENIDVEMTNSWHGRLVDTVRNKTVGQVWIHSPAGANEFELTTTGPSIEVNAAVSGVPTGVLVVQFNPDPDATGDYEIMLKLNGGNTETLFVTVE